MSWNGLPEERETRHGPDQEISAPRCIAEPFELPLDQPGVKTSLEQSIVERCIG
jgi:hypothetical protein